MRWIKERKVRWNKSSKEKDGDGTRIKMRKRWNETSEGGGTRIAEGMRRNKERGEGGTKDKVSEE